MKSQTLSEEQKHNMYSVEMAENHYKKNVYPEQRKDWYHGRVSKIYRNNYDEIFKKDK